MSLTQSEPDSDKEAQTGNVTYTYILYSHSFPGYKYCILNEKRILVCFGVVVSDIVAVTISVVFYTFKIFIHYFSISIYFYFL